MSVEMKLRALELANGFEGTSEEIVKRADAYYRFLTDAGAASASPASAQKNELAGEAKAGNGAATVETGSTEASPAASQSSAASVTTSPSDFDGDVDALKAMCMTFAQKGGDLKAEFQKVGASKWGEVKPEKYADLYAAFKASGKV